MGAWIEISVAIVNVKSLPCRTPRWVRGLKYDLEDNKVDMSYSRTPRWVRGLKYSPSRVMRDLVGGRTPRWVRGLKSHEFKDEELSKIVAPHDGCVD